MNSRTPELKAAYKRCRRIARSRARNFYYAFIALPRAKRDAICAVYAFMRRADDIADAPGVDTEQRRAALDRWLAEWKAVAAGSCTDDPIFLALRDAQQVFDIPSRWLEQLVAGTAMDLCDASVAYATFADLYKYCYLVASVVGLVCIRIFGYTDPRAEALAEDIGIAFQLTNILRDVAEDAAMGRVYLPEEELQRAGISLQTVLQQDPKDTPKVQAVLSVLAARAEELYDSAGQLTSFIHPDSRPALRVLVRIYHRLLRRIEARSFDVFSARIKVPLHEKLAILITGFWAVGRQRLMPDAAGRV